MLKLLAILTFMSMMNFMLSWVELEKSFITSGPDTQIFEKHIGSVDRVFDLGVEGLWVSRLTGGTLMCPWASLSSSSQAKGTKSTLFLMQVCKEQSGLCTLGLRRWFILCLVLVQPRKTGNCPDITEKLLTQGRKASTQTKIVNIS